MSLGIFKNETEWAQYIEETDALIQVHGVRFAAKLAKELERRFFDDQNARMTIRDGRPHNLLSNRQDYAYQLNREIRNAAIPDFQAIDIQRLKVELRATA